jgi:hypothetical protein
MKKCKFLLIFAPLVSVGCLVQKIIPISSAGQFYGYVIAYEDSLVYHGAFAEHKNQTVVKKWNDTTYWTYPEIDKYTWVDSNFSNFRCIHGAPCYFFYDCEEFSVNPLSKRPVRYKDTIYDSKGNYRMEYKYSTEEVYTEALCKYKEKLKSFTAKEETTLLFDVQEIVFFEQLHSDFFLEKVYKVFVSINSEYKFAEITFRNYQYTMDWTWKYRKIYRKIKKQRIHYLDKSNLSDDDPENDKDRSGEYYAAQYKCEQYLKETLEKRFKKLNKIYKYVPKGYEIIFSY